MFDYAQFAAAFPWFFPSAAFLVGAAVGSFLNVCICRIPAGQSVVTPGSHCGCGRPIAWHDNLPVLSWFLLRGRARCCGRPFSIRYPLIELLTAVLFLLCWLAFPPAKAGPGMVFIAVLIVATFIDLEHMIIPDGCTLWAALAGVGLSFACPALHGQHHAVFAVASLRSGAAALTGMFIGSALVLWIALLAEAVLKKEAMGFGDVKFIGAIGAFTGWPGAVFAVFGGAVIGTAWFALALLWQALFGPPAAAVPPPSAPLSATGAAETPAAPLGFGVQVPFGPMLAAGALVYFLCVHRWVDGYFAALAELF
jgi:leader peptidase (prepilin peptidase)/N-methyltransferase